VLAEPGPARRFPPVVDAPRRARAALRHDLLAAGLDGRGDLADTALLLASELFDNAVLHAGTDFELAVRADRNEVTVEVSDHGTSPLEHHLAQPRPRYGRAAAHGRGLMMVQNLATTWGTRHDADGTNTVWFTVHRDGPPSAPTGGSATPLADEDPDEGRPSWPEPSRLRQLLHIPSSLGEGLDTEAVLAELARRLREVLDVAGASVEVDYGDGAGARTLTRDGVELGATPGAHVLDLPLPLAAPLRGRLRLTVGQGRAGSAEMAGITEVGQLAAHRIALATESNWLRGADRHRRAWMTYLADTSQLLGQSLDVERTVNIIPQVVVPRLGQWCAVYLTHPDRALELAGLTHADEERLPELRAALRRAPPEIAAALRVQPGQVSPHPGPAWITSPAEGIAVALTAAERRVGVLVVGRPVHRAHTVEDIALITDVARRATLAIDNAQRTAEHVATSQALQRALLPRRLPAVGAAEFAAQYLPASTGSDVGGDFYDVNKLGPDRWLAVIGDVCGKGARAAARAGQVRDALRVLARQHHSLPEVLALLNDLMMEADDPSQFCTLAALDIQPDNGRDLTGGPAGLVADLVLAGHPKPVLIRADGTAELIGDHGTALGLVEQLQLSRTRHHLAPGDTLLTYTDGVTEQRGSAGSYGTAGLLAAAGGHWAPSPSELIATVRVSIEAFPHNRLRDDIALLAVRATQSRTIEP
jgi:serine phosphatase RsbU (regulator of sigma subunit)/anti-sigma regulatory factor (Ser/Thr protein kinase)